MKEFKPKERYILVSGAMNKFQVTKTEINKEAAELLEKEGAIKQVANVKEYILTGDLEDI